MGKFAILPNVMIRKASTDDLESIFHLYQEYSLDIHKVNNFDYATKVQQEGFLVALENKVDLSERMEKNFLFNVYEGNGKVLGFININKEIYFPEEAENIIWIDKTLKQKYFHGDTSIVLHEIIVDRNYKGKGIATQLLDNCIPNLIDAGYTDLFSIVTLAPVSNCPSLIFHTKNEFERACVTMPIDLFGLKNYQSLLFHKVINTIS